MGAAGLGIVLATPIFPPDAGGPATFAKEMGTRLARRGHAVSVVAMQGRIPHDAPGTFDVVSVPVHGGRLRRQARFVAALTAAARSADVVVALDAGVVGPASWMAARRAGVPFILRFPGDLAWETAQATGQTRKGLETWLARPRGFGPRLVLAGERFALRRAAAIVCPSRYLSDVVRRHHGVPADHLHVIPSSCDVPPVMPPETSRRPSDLVTAGRLVPWKGVDALIAAVASVPHATLDVYGEGPERPALEDLAKNSGGQVRLHGGLSHEALMQRLAKAGVFLLNSTYEGLPHMVLEAMAHGCPVVATDIPGTAEAVPPGTGRLVPPGDVQAFAAAVDAAMVDWNHTLGMARMAYERVGRENSWDATLIRFEALLARVCNRVTA